MTDHLNTAATWIGGALLIAVVLVLAALVTLLIFGQLRDWDEPK